MVNVNVKRRKFLSCVPVTKRKQRIIKEKRKGLIKKRAPDLKTAGKHEQKKLKFMRSTSSVAYYSSSFSGLLGSWAQKENSKIGDWIEEMIVVSSILGISSMRRVIECPSKIATSVEHEVSLPVTSRHVPFHSCFGKPEFFGSREFDNWAVWALLDNIFLGSKCGQYFFTSLRKRANSNYAWLGISRLP